MSTGKAEIREALERARGELLNERNASGHWEGELSSSALSTATAVTALAIYSREAPETPGALEPLIQAGLDWLARHVNEDGGWGDTTRSLSNISTTALCWAAYGAVPGTGNRYASLMDRARAWLERASGGPGIERLTEAIIRGYGKDRTFSVPILTMCALAGRLGEGTAAWRRVIPLPFELAACPHQMFAALRLPVVSYALPALIAMGQARHFHAPSANPAARLIRNAARGRTLRVLRRIQPSSGGFLEATPLTSFVTMSLAASGHARHGVARDGIGFLVSSARADGSWPIDTNLATWVTTLSVNALGLDGLNRLGNGGREGILQWLLNQQYREEHPYTHAAPGGWAWTDLPGGVPDADDTAGALLALRALACTDMAAVEAGLEWLLNLQNRDGGIPTFCRGWTSLPFDRSSPDLTAHALRAWRAWEGRVNASLGTRMARGRRRALEYLLREQTASRARGGWLPLWFGNQHDDAGENHVYGTARVLTALAGETGERAAAAVRRGIRRLLEFQREDGGWSGSQAGPATIEETGLAVEALAAAAEAGAASAEEHQALGRGAAWLARRVLDESWREPAPIGFYFAKLWYYERLYPMIFATGALEAAARRKRP